jgi:bacterioferritin-associated ferredoxin
MYVCVCKAVSDRSIRALAERSEVLTLRQLAKNTGAGTCCGKCVPELRQLLTSSMPVGSLVAAASTGAERWGASAA